MGLKGRGCVHKIAEGERLEMGTVRLCWYIGDIGMEAYL